MELFVNGYSALGATNKEEMVAITLQEIRDTQHYTVIGQPVVYKASGYRSNGIKVCVPVITKIGNRPGYCVRTFNPISMESLEKVPYVDLTDNYGKKNRW